MSFYYNQVQSRNYTCGPAALATVLQNMGINSTEEELIVLAGTDASGTTMHGLSEAAEAKGLSATGMKLSVDELRPNNIVHIILDGEGHYSVVREITNESVYLADPSKGNIELSREKFSEIYTGNALVITNPQEVNQTETSNQTSSVQSHNSQTLTTDAMQNIQGRLIWKPAVIIGFIVKVLFKAMKIGKAAWRIGIRGRALSRRIERDILRRVPFAGHRKVKAAAGAAALVIATDIARNQLCWWGTTIEAKMAAAVAFKVA